MKKFVVLASVVFAGYTVKAQGFYTELNVGYGIGMPSTTLGTDTYMDLGGTGSYTKVIQGSLGGGLNITLAPGYMFNKHIGVELGLNYFMGAKTLIQSTTSSNSNVYDKTTAHSNQFRLLPSVVFSTGGEKLFGFAKAGLAIPVAGSTKGSREISNVTPLGTVLTNVESTTHGNVTVGFRGSVGIGYNINDMIALSLEVSHTSLTIKPKSRTVDSYEVGGQDILNLIATYDKETTYVDELNTSSNNDNINPNYSTNTAKDDIGQKTNFSQLGIAIGVKFSF